MSRKLASELFNEYIKNATLFCSRMTNLPPLVIETKLKQLIESRVQRPSIEVLETIRPGEQTVKEYDLWEFTRKIAKEVITPSGSVYLNSDQHEALFPKMLKDFTIERDRLKCKQFEAKAKGDEHLVAQYKDRQTSKKITTNAGPGGMGSEYNFLYDVGNYNSVTSIGRCMIAASYTFEEHLLGGNFAHFTPRMLINHLVLLIKHAPDANILFDLMREYQLKQPTMDEVSKWLISGLKQYMEPSKSELEILDKFIHQLQIHELAFVWYYQNLTHIIWWNQDTFLPKLQEMLNADRYEDGNYTANDLKQLDKDLIIMLTIQLSETDILSGIKPDDLEKQAPEKISKFVSVAKGIQNNIDRMNKIFDVFVNISLQYPQINQLNLMNRVSTTTSDTDSIIFSTMRWVYWFTKQYKVTPEAYQIVSLVVYWLSKHIVNILQRFAEDKGISPAKQKLLKMKNEFLYVVMMTFAICKHYAGIVTIQEGVILKQPDIDIKGVQLKGSFMCAETREYIENFIEKYILRAAMQEQLDIEAIIQELVRFEYQIYQSVQEGKTTYLEMIPIRMKNEITGDIGSSSYQYLIAWNEIMGEEFGQINPPGKFPVIELLEITKDKLTALTPKLRGRFTKYFDIYKAYPKYMIINPMIDKIPSELIPLVNLRKVVYRNTRSLYMILDGLNCSIGHDNYQNLYSDLMYSDLYPNT